MDSPSHEWKIRRSQPGPDAGRRPTNPAQRHPDRLQTLDSGAKTTDRGKQPDTAAGTVVGFIGGLAAVGGIIFLLYQYIGHATPTDLVVGAVFVFGGLLLRIESAIWGTGGRGQRLSGSA